MGYWIDLDNWYPYMEIDGVCVNLNGEMVIPPWVDAVYWNLTPYFNMAYDSGWAL